MRVTRDDLRRWAKIPEILSQLPEDRLQLILLEGPELGMDDLARAVREVAADGLLRQRLIATGKERVDTRFRWSEHVARLLETVSARNGNDA